MDGVISKEDDTIDLQVAIKKLKADLRALSVAVSQVDARLVSTGTERIGGCFNG